MGLRNRLTMFVAAMAIAVFVPASPSFGVTAGAVTTDNSLLTFDTASPGTVTSGPRAITGLQAGEGVLGIDIRPATNQLYALGSTGRLYRLNTATAAATQVGSGSATLTGTDFGFDFNPVGGVDRFRVNSDADQNFRLNPNDGTVSTDTSVFFAPADTNAGDDPNIVGMAYSNNFPGATQTTTYVIDSGQDVLARLGGANSAAPSPNGGQLFTINSLSFSSDGRVGFDILSVPGSETAFATMATPSPTTSALYTVNLTTGAVTPVGNIGGGSPVKAFALGVPPSLEPVPADPGPTDPAPTDPDPTPTPTPTPDTTSPEALLALSATQKLKRVMKAGGVGAELSCDEACTATASLTAGKRALGERTASLAEAGVGTISVDLSKAGEKFLKKRQKSDAEKTKLSLGLAISDSSQNATNLTRKLTLKH